MLVSGSDGVGDDSLTASSFSASHPPSEARLNSRERPVNGSLFGGGWKPLEDSTLQYIQVRQVPTDRLFSAGLKPLIHCTLQFGKTYGGAKAICFVGVENL